MKKKILITGGCGFIGSHLVELFLRNNFYIKVLDKYNINNSWGFLEKYKTNKNIEVILGDVRDFDCVQTSLKDCKSIIHLAALGGIPYSYFSPLAYLRTNIEGTYNILEASKNIKNLEQIIIFSTSEIYGSAEFTPMNENHPKKAQSPYAASKIAADQLALSYYRSFNLPVKIVRPFNTFGERQSDRAIIPTIISQILDNSVKKIKLGNLYATRDFTYVSDICSAVYKIFKLKVFIGKEVNIGSGKEISINNLVKKIMFILKKNKRVKIIKLRKRSKISEVNRLISDNSLLKTYTDWTPKYEIDDGIKKTIKWVKNNKFLYNSKNYNI